MRFVGEIIVGVELLIYIFCQQIDYWFSSRSFGLLFSFVD